MPPKPQPLEDRFWRFVKPGPKLDCWPWRGGTKNQAGYGQLRIGRNGPSVSVHRLSFMLHKGDIPIGLHVLHTCDNPPCVNPDHLYTGTAKDNAQDCIKRGRRAETHQPHARFRKLTDDQVRDIRQDERPAWRVAHYHGISETAVYNVRARRRKALVPD